MKPWFEKEITEGDVIKFPEPKEKVIQMPNIASVSYTHLTLPTKA